MNEPHKGDPVGRFFAAAVITVGALIFSLCGLCTAVFLIAGVMPPGDSSLSFIALFVGGIPALIGFMILRFGLAMYREESNRPPPRDNV